MATVKVSRTTSCSRAINYAEPLLVAERSITPNHEQPSKQG
ncbi:hypothetical protein NUITMVRE12_28440 [Enterococcus faecium]|nr:hypothetical protein NUITMVRE2_29480 [Enterococcus faecium]GMR80078.1 hypothetical protein NUITMVRE12_28440 [Enterococcus faecium]GMS03161.1 hypothetical protein NUITMVRE1_28310 [Enterococcus faecium]GMS35135.1 hypothetical protein NUITMVRE2_29480 [Enterococcus faecium]